MRQNKHLNEVVEQDRRSVKRVTQPMLGFNSFGSARILIGGIETMRMIHQWQMNFYEGSNMPAAEQFHSAAV
jgi:putative transposase